MRTHLALLATVALGCKSVDPAPAELDALLPYFFTSFEDAEDAQLAEAVRNLDSLVDGAAIEYQEGFVTTLTTDDVASTGYTHADPADAIGLYIVNPVDCTMDQMAELVTMKDQVGTYGTYDDFDREWTTDIEAFRSQAELLGGWDDSFHYKNGFLGIDYTAKTEGEGRWVPDLGEDTPWGPILLTRRSMLEPAVNAKDDHSYPQDWRAEVYYERSNGQIVHLAVMWREAIFGSLSHEDELAQRTMLNGLKDWDKDSGKACAE